MCPWPSGPGVGLPNRTGGFDSRRALSSDRLTNAEPSRPVGNPADHSRSEREMLWVRVPPGPLDLECPGGPAEWSPRSHREDRGFKSLPGYCMVVGWALASPRGRNPPASRAVQVQLLPDTLRAGAKRGQACSVENHRFGGTDIAVCANLVEEHRQECLCHQSYQAGQVPMPERPQGVRTTVPDPFSHRPQTAL